MNLDFRYLTSLLTSALGWHVRLYIGGVLVAESSPVALPFDPASLLLCELLDQKSETFCFVGPEYTYYGVLNELELGYTLVLGPVSDTQPTRSQCLGMLRQIGVGIEFIDDFCTYMRGQRIVCLETFSSLLALLDYLVRREVSSFPRFLPTQTETEEGRISSNNDRASMLSHGPVHNTYTYECMILACIETGDVDGLRSLGSQWSGGSFGKLADDTVRSRKNLFICLATLVCRAATRGGLDQELAFTLSDLYIQRMEQATEASRVQALSEEMKIDFCNRVALVSCGGIHTRLTNRVLQFISQNLDTRWTTDDIAAHLGTDRTQLCRAFKRITGKSIMTQTRTVRIATAKRMLASTDAPLSEISVQLAFSSQSHFQNTFKRMTGLTPTQYREAVRRG